VEERKRRREPQLRGEPIQTITPGFSELRKRSEASLFGMKRRDIPQEKREGAVHG